MSIKEYYKNENSKLYNLKIEVSSIDSLISTLKKIKKDYKNATLYNVESQLSFMYYFINKE